MQLSHVCLANILKHRICPKLWKIQMVPYRTSHYVIVSCAIVLESKPLIDLWLPRMFRTYGLIKLIIIPY